MQDKNYERISKGFFGRLKSKTAFGESRHQGKIDGTAEQKIYSHNTFKTYNRMCDGFAKYAAEQGAHNANQAEKYANDYIQTLIKEDKSAWTIQTTAAALTKVYGKRVVTDELPSRHRKDIVRSRMDTERARHFSKFRNAELINFCTHTGLRRSELERLDNTINKLEERNGQWYITNVKGKGGRVRDVPILKNDQATIDRFNDHEGVVWGKVHSNANIHGYRADYACALYNNLARDIDTLPTEDIYCCRYDMAGTHFDKEAMREVSEALGHSRIDVIASNYLYDLKQ